MALGGSTGCATASTRSFAEIAISHPIDTTAA
eukprot:CAMPEP_0117658870 /NCGR_PEP_ID=MMETSP0804-20121206/6102_1 /TAXON_ID=1074897 /ORGANISM="Tetraselmis astigmatica, Strain CCMP880" /LENGTH=31 /DNA_ID= /DNA_START= /DNA_END= /DNA_ORIENTATION=